MTDMTLFDALSQPNFEFEHASIDVTVPKDNCIEHRCYIAKSIAELKFNLELIFKDLDNVLIGVHGKLNGEYKCYICFANKEQFLANDEWSKLQIDEAWKKVPQYKPNIFVRFWNWLRGKHD